MNNKLSQSLYISEEEISALETAENVLMKLQDEYKKDDVLMSHITGEIVQIKELARVRGVLSFLQNNQTVTVNP